MKIILIFIFTSSVLLATYNKTGSKKLSQCSVFDSAVYGELQKVQNCTADSDCIESPYVGEGAVCALLVNKNLSLNAANVAIANYQAKCGKPWRYRCIKNEPLYVKACRNNLCVAIQPLVSPVPTGPLPTAGDGNVRPCLTDLNCKFKEKCAGNFCVVDQCKNCKLDEDCIDNKCVPK